MQLEIWVIESPYYKTLRNYTFSDMIKDHATCRRSDNYARVIKGRARYETRYRSALHSIRGYTRFMWKESHLFISLMYFTFASELRGKNISRYLSRSKSTIAAINNVSWKLLCKCSKRKPPRNFRRERLNFLCVHLGLLVEQVWRQMGCNIICFYAS